MTDYYEDACYLSNSEAEPDSETEDCGADDGSGARLTNNPEPELAWDDPQALLNTWLGELDSLQAVSLKFTFLFFSRFPCKYFPIVTSPK